MPNSLPDFSFNDTLTSAFSHHSVMEEEVKKFPETDTIYV